MAASRPPDSIGAPADFAAEAANFREVLTRGRSSVFLQLFDFLVERSNDERAPKEVEIAVALFGNDATRDRMPDAGVRVYVHRLRKRLDDFYSGKSGARLEIPKGEYRLVLSSRPVPRARNPFGWWPRPRWPATSHLSTGLALIAVSMGLVWWLQPSQERPGRLARELRETTFWSQIGADAPAQIVVGDSYVMAETENQLDVESLILDPSIRSREDLGGYLKTHPEDFYRLYDLDLHYTPIGTAIAAWNLLPAVSALNSRGNVGLRLMSSSRLKLDAVEAGDVVYVGRLSDLGSLAAPLAQAPGFTTGGLYGELVDRYSGKRYIADVSSGKNRKPRFDYGYLAILSWASGKHILIIAGIGDAGVQSMASLATEPAQLDQLAKRAGTKGPLEALFRVRAVGNVVLDKTLVVARPVRARDASGSAPTTD